MKCPWLICENTLQPSCYRSDPAPRQAARARTPDHQGRGEVRRRLQGQVGRRQEARRGPAEEAARVGDGRRRQGQDHQRPQDSGMTMPFGADAE